MRRCCTRQRLRVERCPRCSSLQQVKEPLLVQRANIAIGRFVANQPCLITLILLKVSHAVAWRLGGRTTERSKLLELWLRSRQSVKASQVQREAQAQSAEQRCYSLGCWQSCRLWHSSYNLAKFASTAYKCRIFNLSPDCVCFREAVRSMATQITQSSMLRCTGNLLPTLIHDC